MQAKTLVSLISFLFLFALAITQPQAQLSQSFEGTSKGVSLWNNSIEKTEIKATNENGPWSIEVNRPKIFVLPFGGPDKETSEFIKRIAHKILEALSKQPTIEVISEEQNDAFLKSKGLVAFPNDEKGLKNLYEALSTFDVVIKIDYGNGWLKLTSYRAKSKAEADYHSFAVYFGEKPLIEDAENAVSSERIMESVGMLLGRKK